MRGLSYMGRVVVKLIIIAIIAFVVITTAVFIIKKYNNETRQEGVSQTEEANSGVATLPGAVVEGDTNKSSDPTKSDSDKGNKDQSSSDKRKTDNANNSSPQPSTDSQAQSDSSNNNLTSEELPKTGPSDFWQAAGVLALIAFSGTYYFNSLRR